MPDPDILIEDETLRQGFTQIPNAILRRPDISTGAKLTYMVLLSYAWQSDSCFPGQERLAADMGVTKRSVITYLQQLQDVGLLIVKRRGLGKTNLYFLPRFNSRGESFALQTGSANFASQQVQESTPTKAHDLHPKNTQQKSSTQRNTNNTQPTDDTKMAYFARFMDLQAEQLERFHRSNTTNDTTDNHSSE